MKKIKVGVILIFVLLAMCFISVFIYRISMQDKTKLSDGIYTIENFERYPEAYIEVKNDCAIFREIDLNAIYKEHICKREIEIYKAKVKNVNEKHCKEIEDSIDLNLLFCKDFFEINYEKLQGHPSKYEYVYIMGDITSNCGLQITYNVKEKTIRIDNEPTEMVFVKK